jgi:hypothetical protein
MMLLQVTLAAAQDQKVAAPVFTRADPPKIAWDKKIEVATGGGYRGPWRMNDSDFRYVDDPTVAINEKGVVGVAWADQARKDIFFQAFEPDGKPRFEKAVNVSRSPRIFSWLPRLVMASRNAGEVYILWQEIVFSGGSHGGEIFFARSTDGGSSFSDPVNLSNTPAGDGKGRLTREYWHNGSLDLVVGPEGNLYAAWTEYEGALWVSRSTDRGARFFPPLQVASQGIGTPARGPSLAVDGAGVIYLAWTVGEDRAADIHLAKSTDRGRSFSKPRPVFQTDGHADAPKIAVDGNGTVHLAYAESPAGPFQRYRIHYSRSNDGGRAFEKPREISGPQTEQLASAHFPALSVDGKGNVYVIWEMYTRPVSYPRGLGFASSSVGGRTFAPASVIPGSIEPGQGVNGSLQGLLMRKLAVNRAGAMAIVNSTFWANERSHVWLLRGQAESPRTLGRSLTPCRDWSGASPDDGRVRAHQCRMGDVAAFAALCRMGDVAAFAALRDEMGDVAVFV